MHTSADCILAADSKTKKRPRAERVVPSWSQLRANTPSTEFNVAQHEADEKIRAICRELFAASQNKVDNRLAERWIELLRFAVKIAPTEAELPFIGEFYATLRPTKKQKVIEIMDEDGLVDDEGKGKDKGEGTSKTALPEAVADKPTEAAAAVPSPVEKSG